MEKSFSVIYEITKNRSLGKTGPSIYQIFVGSHKIGQNIESKVRKSSTTCPYLKTLMSVFSYFLACYWQSIISGRETGD